MNNQPIDFTNLDFFEIKQQIIDFYQSKTEFQDVNFLGSGANLLMDSIAYAIHTMAVHANFAISETFLDSVLLRTNAISRAKELGYTTATVSSAIMRVKVTVSNLTALDADITLPRGTLFEASSSSGAFVNLDGATLSKEKDELGNYVDETIRTGTFDINQGQLVERTYTANNLENFERFILRETNIDGRQIRVSVDGEDWDRYDGTLEIQPDTKIWYAVENNQNQIEVYFGDDHIGAKPSNGQSIKIEYLVTDGIDGNDINVITYPSQSGNDDWSIEVVEQSIGGADEQSTNRVANTAPLNHAAQKRAVITNDYIGLLKAEFSWIETLNVWGGEDNVPPQYGKVFVAIKPFGSDELAPTLADQVKSKVIEKYNVLGIIAELVDPDYTHVNITSDVYWKPSKTDLDAATLLNDYVEPAITNYFISDVTDFERGVFFSNLVAQIDDSDKAITHNDTTLSIFKKYKPTPFVQTSKDFNFFNPIVPNTIRSDEFDNVSGVTISFRDNGNGLLDEYRDDQLNQSGIGVVDYDNGVVEFSYYEFEVLNNTEIRINATPATQDIIAGKNNLIIKNNTNVTMKQL